MAQCSGVRSKKFGTSFLVAAFILNIIYVNCVLAQSGKETTHPCEGNTPVKCFNLGVLRMQEEKYQEALNIFAKTCREGVAFGCANAGALLEKDGQNSEAKKFFKTGCEKNDSVNCFNLAALEKKLGNYQEARRLYQATCDKDYAKSCTNLGLEFKRISQIEKAKFYFQKSCQLSEMAGGCFNLAILLNSTNEKAAAAHLFEKLCAQDDAEACSLFADYLAGTRNNSAAEGLYKKACAKGHKDSCKLVTALKFENNTTTMDPNLPSNDKPIPPGELFALCMKKQLEYCSEIDIDDSNASSAYLFGCEQSNGNSCARLGQYFEVRKFDKNKAKQYYTKACKLKERTGCDALTDLEKEEENERVKNQTLEIQKAIAFCEKTKPKICSPLKRIISHLFKDLDRDAQKQTNLSIKQALTLLEEKYDESITHSLEAFSKTFDTNQLEYYRLLNLTYQCEDYLKSKGIKPVEKRHRQQYVKKPESMTCEEYDRNLIKKNREIKSFDSNQSSKSQQIAYGLYIWSKKIIYESSFEIPVEYFKPCEELKTKSKYCQDFIYHLIMHPFIPETISVAAEKLANGSSSKKEIGETVKAIKEL